LSDELVPVVLNTIQNAEVTKTFHLQTSPHALEIINRSVEIYSEANLFRYSEPAKYRQLLDTLYNEEITRRMRLLNHVKEVKNGIRDTMYHISRREYIIDFIVDWAWTYDPRLAALNLPTALPFIPFPKQVEFIEWLYNLYLQQINGLAEKARDAGATWLLCIFIGFEWRWTDGFAGGIGSNKLDNVDDRDNPDCIFEKLRSFLKMLPPFWFPTDFNPQKHSKLGNLFNPNMQSYITGQGGKDIGRGGRRTFYLVDESASLEYPLKADAALSAVTNCKVDLSTPKGMNHFGQKRHNGKIPVFTFHWKDDPRKNKVWYDKFSKDHDPVVVAQEVDINYHSSVEGIFIKPEWILAAVDLNLKPLGPKGAALDVAAGGTNKSALAFRYGPVASVESFDIKNGVQLTHTAIDLCNKAEVQYFHYDKIGVGHAVYSTLESTERKMDFPHFGLEASGSPSDLYYDELKGDAKDIFINARAEWWYVLARRFEKTFEHVHGLRKYPEEELISIQNDGELISQLASPKKFYTETGKIKVESKPVMIKRGIQSPDKADALVMAFLPSGAGNIHIINNIDVDMIAEQRINWELPEEKLRHYGAVVMDDDLSIHCMFAIWDQEEQMFYVYDEHFASTPDCDIIVQNIIQKMQLKRYSIDKLFGNSDLFEEFQRTVGKEFNNAFSKQLHEQQTVKLKEAKKYNPQGSLLVLKRLMENKRIKINPKCRKIYDQFISWKLENKTFKYHGMQLAILLILSELIGYEPFKEAIIKRKEYSKLATGQPVGLLDIGQPDPQSI